MLISQICKEEDFRTSWFLNACAKLRQPVRYHRKLWEYCYIYQGLHERGMLGPNRTGLGFGVGKEPLVSLFASLGCRVTATDLDVNAASLLGWVSSNQYSSNIEDLNLFGLCDPDQFRELVSFYYLDMNKIDSKYELGYDFTWSSCCFEHCGSIELGKRFILNQMKCLRPGGIAIHTTEYNLSSNDETIDHRGTVLFRKQDIEWMVNSLRAEGHTIDIDYSIGTGVVESHIDVPPYTHEHQLRILIGQYVSTSIGLIIQKST
ncbi:MAG: SAM-dependent methyltransferase [Brevibacillus sp.]|nr:SAM-dependent methyltransferase [Brevibacillus sp.]